MTGSHTNHKCRAMESHFLAVKRACARLTKVASAEALATAGLPGAQAQALLMLSQLNGCKIGELGKTLGLGKPATTTLVSRMEKAKLLRRRADKADARANTIELTPTGRKALAKVKRMIAAFDERLVHGFSPHEIEVIETYLARAARIEKL